MRWLLRFATQRALTKGSDRFTALAVVLGLLRLVQKMSRTGERTIYKHNLQPGEILVVREEKLPR